MAAKSETREERFHRVFRHYGSVASFADRRGSRDPEALAAETMSIAWRRLESIDSKACLPWLIATARNLLLAEFRKNRDEPVGDAFPDQRDETIPDLPVESLDPEIDRALAALEPLDREAILLVAWDELTPKEAAESLGIKPTAFRVRLHRARRRFAASFENPATLDTLTGPKEERA